MEQQGNLYIISPLAKTTETKKNYGKLHGVNILHHLTPPSLCNDRVLTQLRLASSFLYSVIDVEGYLIILHPPLSHCDYKHVWYHSAPFYVVLGTESGHHGCWASTLSIKLNPQSEFRLLKEREKGLDRRLSSEAHLVLFRVLEFNSPVQLQIGSQLPNSSSRECDIPFWFPESPAHCIN